LTFALGRIEPHSVPLFHYLGFDVIDVGRALGAAAQAIRLWPRGYESIPKTEELRYCPCHACSLQTNLASLDRDTLYDVLLAHNIGLYRSFLSESMNAARLGQLRYLVESLTHSSPASAAFLRIIDRELYFFAEEFTNTSGSGVLALIGPESYNSPVVKRFREYVASRYVPPPYKKLIVVLPCSARKPYSDSKSHKLFREVIDANLKSSRFAVAETILTSPLGVVPRELERTYPASVYDLPVTGDWDSEETVIASDALVTHLAKFDKSAVVVAHVSGGYEDAVKGAESRTEQSIIYTTSGQPATSKESLESLGETLEELVDVLSLRA
jgi:archaeosine synthase